MFFPLRINLFLLKKKILKEIATDIKANYRIFRKEQCCAIFVLRKHNKKKAINFACAISYLVRASSGTNPKKSCNKMKELIMGRK